MLDDELLKEVKKATQNYCFCFKKKIKKELSDKVRDRLKDEKANELVDF